MAASAAARCRFFFSRQRPRRLKTLPIEVVLGHSISGYRSSMIARSFRGPRRGMSLRAWTTRSSTSAEIACGFECGRRDFSSTARTSWSAARKRFTHA